MVEREGWAREKVEMVFTSNCTEVILSPYEGWFRFFLAHLLSSSLHGIDRVGLLLIIGMALKLASRRLMAFMIGGHIQINSP